MIVAGLLPTRRDNYGGDPLITRAKRPPSFRDGARCDAAFQKSVSWNVVTLCVPNSIRRSGVKQWWYLTMFTWYFMIFGMVFDDVRWYLMSSTILIPHYPPSTASKLLQHAVLLPVVISI